MLKVNKTLNRLYLEKMNLNMNNYNFILNGLNENDKIIHFNFSFNPSVKPRLFLEYFLHRKKYPIYINKHLRNKLTKYTNEGKVYC